MLSITDRWLKSSLLWGALFLGCAHQVPPTGGPIDEIPPVVQNVFPSSGTTGFGRSSPITITFDEWVAPASARKSVSVFPPPPEGIDIRVRAKTVRLIPKGPLADSTTYHIELNSSLEDLHGNAIRSPVTIVFSTGNALDSGSISGCVIDPGRLVGQPKVALFRVIDSVVSDSVYFDLPDYLTQTDSSGGFSFTYVRTGLYDVLGFVDAIPNGRFQPTEGQAYAPERMRIGIGTQDTSIQLFPVYADTTAPAIQAVRAHSPAILLGRWNRVLPPTEQAFWRRWRLEEIDTPDSSIEITDYQHLGGTQFIARLSRSMKATGYHLIYTVSDPKRVFGGDSVAVDSVRFNGTALPDTVGAELVATQPTGPTSLRTDLTAVFSEPVRLSRAYWPLVDTITLDTVFLRADTTYTDTVNFVTETLLSPGKFYRFLVPWGAFEDLGGNVPLGEPDTSGLRITFSTANQEELCQSLSGKGECLEENAFRKWVFTLLGGKRIITDGSDGTFRFDSLLAGEGTLALFYDYNDDNEPTPGNLFPWSAPEPYVWFPDTIEARARWDIEGVDVSACSLCKTR